MALIRPLLMLLVSITMMGGEIAHGSAVAPNCQTCYRNAFENLMKATVFDDCCQIAKACKVLKEGTDTGVFDLHGGCLRPKDNFQLNIPVIKARCDMETDDGGWTVILRRKHDSTPRINFKRPWEDYEEGFGDLNSEFWFGLSKIHCLTQRNEVELRIELKNNDGTGKTYTYDTFEVSGPEDNYRLKIVSSGGSGFDPLDISNRQPFSAYNKDNADGTG